MMSPSLPPPPPRDDGDDGDDDDDHADDASDDDDRDDGHEHDHNHNRNDDDDDDHDDNDDDDDDDDGYERPRRRRRRRLRTTRSYIQRPSQDLVTQVTDLVVIRSHISAEFEDPAFCESGGNGSSKVSGRILRINNIESLAALDALWLALLAAVLGETLLPDSCEQQLVACVRAKDLSDKKVSQSVSRWVGWGAGWSGSVWV